MSFERQEFLTGLGVPHLGCVVQGCAGQALAVAGIDHAAQSHAVTFEGDEHLASLAIQYLRGFVPQSAGQALAVRAEDDAVDAAEFTDALVPPNFLAGLRIPY